MLPKSQHDFFNTPFAPQVSEIYCRVRKLATVSCGCLSGLCGWHPRGYEWMLGQCPKAQTIVQQAGVMLYLNCLCGLNKRGNKYSQLLTQIFLG